MMSFAVLARFATVLKAWAQTEIVRANYPAAAEETDDGAVLLVSVSLTQKQYGKQKEDDVVAAPATAELPPVVLTSAGDDVTPPAGVPENPVVTTGVELLREAATVLAEVDSGTVTSEIGTVVNGGTGQDSIFGGPDDKSQAGIQTLALDAAGVEELKKRESGDDSLEAT